MTISTIMGKKDTSLKNRKHHDSSDSEDSDFEEMNDKYAGKPLNKDKFKQLLGELFSSKVDKYYKENEEKQKKHKKRSKTTDKKKKKNKRRDDSEDEDEDDDEANEIEYVDKNGNKINVLVLEPLEVRGSKYNMDEDDFEDYDSEDDEDYEEEDSDEDDEEDYEEDSEDDDEEDDSDDEDEEEDSEDEDEEEDSDEEDEDNEEDDDDEEENTSSRRKKYHRKCKNKKSYAKKNKNNDKDIENEIEEDEKHLSELENLHKENKSKILKRAIDVCKKEIKDKKKILEKKERKQKNKNNQSFRSQLRNKNKLNDVSYFDKLSLKEQNKILEEVKKLNSIVEIEKPYRITLLESDIPPEFKAAAIKKINTLRMMEPGGGEFYKIKNWIDTFMSIPFGKHKNLPITADDGVDKCHEFMESAKQTLDNAVYGLNDAKMQIMQLMGQLITNPVAVGTTIAIQGPMGTGKTTMVKEGISKILGRDFAFIALGGATDSSFLEGHSYTYEGSSWGQIVNILIKSKSMNPVIYFDELDKVSDTPKGEEIIGILTHLTDTSQNTQFHDKYFSEIDFDLSKCLFIFSYNDITKINPILRDRMYTIQTKGYDSKEKIIISRNHILPKIREQVKFKEEDVIIHDDVIRYIIENHTMKEQGLRNLKRCYEIIYTKLNLYRLMKPGTNLFEEDMSIKVEFPFTVTQEMVDKLIKKRGNVNVSAAMMYC